MKNFFDVTYKNSSKAAAIFFAFLLIVGLIAFLMGCGDENVVNNGNLPREVFKIDSFALWSNVLGDVDTNFTDIFRSDLDSFAITFTISTNNPNTLTTAQISFIDTGNALLEYTFNEEQLNESYMAKLYSTNGLCSKNVNIALNINNGNLNFPKYLKISDFKITRIN